MWRLFKILRAFQWAKNIFILTPLIFGAKLFNATAISKTILVFILFSFTSSAMYLINDICDVEEDKQHPEKCNRALASGIISILHAKVLALTLCAIALPSSFFIDITVGWIILSYIILNLIYTKFLKHIAIIDVFCIGALFFLRILAGSVASQVSLSNWIVICTILLALFLGFNKRLYDIEFSKGYRQVFEYYNKYFIDRMILITSSSVVIAYSLYVMDPITIAKFGTNHLIYTVPFVYYGIFRYLYVIDAKLFGGDPSRILLKDNKLQINLILWFITCIAVIYVKL